MISQTVRGINAHRVCWRVREMVWGKSFLKEVEKERAGEGKEIKFSRSQIGVIVEAGGEEEDELAGEKVQEE